MPKFSVKLDGFKFNYVDPATGVANLREVAEVEADVPEMAQVQFCKLMGINSTTRKFTIKRIGGEPAAEVPSLDELGDGPSIEDEIAEMADTIPDEPDVLGPPNTPAQPKIVALPDEPKAEPARAGGKRGRGAKPTTLVSDPDGLRDEIAKL